METCEHCGAFLFTILESNEIEVTGEIAIKIVCPVCNKLNYKPLYEIGNKDNKIKEK